MFRTTGIMVAAFFLLTSIGLGQDNRFDVSLGGGAVIPNQPSGNGTTLTPTKSGAVLITGATGSPKEVRWSSTTGTPPTRKSIRPLR